MSFLGTAARASPPATSGRGASPAALQARAPAARALLAHPRRAQRAVRTASVRVRAERATRTASGGVKVYEQEVTSSKLKSVNILSADGARMSLEEVIGTGNKKAVVVFLRHLGWCVPRSPPSSLIHPSPLSPPSTATKTINGAAALKPSAISSFFHKYVSQHVTWCN
mmetsp:Transcript_2258/g.5633  ORF Transcript_2258/g.5633 Transcript_2258/m.5633 type:complete len:168 (-) Transcript_2258:300-803(-)